LKLKHLAHINLGYPFRGKISEIEEADVLAVQMKDVASNTGVYWLGCVKTELGGKRKPDWLQLGDILFTARGSNNYAVQIDETVAGYQAVAAPHFYVVRIKKDTLLPEYLAWLLNQEPCQRYFQRKAEGSLHKSIRRSVLENTPIAVPTLEKQHAIIGFANTLKRESQLLEQLVQNGQKMMQTIANDLLQNTGKTNYD
jgi:restriction endonuclease S subunit